jgi:DNA-binding XRE family transcriptional regulator
MDVIMKSHKPDKRLPIPVQRVLRALGRDMREARIKRRISTAIMAERASISRTTLHKVEKGDSGVSLGIYATVLFVLGLSDRLGELADARTDTVGPELAEEFLPQRIRHSRKPKPTSTNRPGTE